MEYTREKAIFPFPVLKLSPKLSFEKWCRKYGDEVEELFYMLKDKLQEEGANLLDHEDALDGFKIFMYDNSVKR